jgi:hypothetical protein
MFDLSDIEKPELPVGPIVPTTETDGQRGDRRVHGGAEVVENPFLISLSD